MIIDSHLHFGRLANFNIPEEILIESMNKYNIDFGIVSNIEGIEFDSDLKEIPKEHQVSQLDLNKRTLEFVKQYEKRMRAKFWIKPHTEEFTNEIAAFILNNKEYFVALKVHPHHSNIKLTDERCKKYLKFANKHNIPIAVHTAMDKNSHPYYVYEAAKQYPNTKFIMVHMGLGSDNIQAINYIKKLPNLYGDTSWVHYRKVFKAIKKSGSHKVLFGTDNAIDGVDTYKKYGRIMNKAKFILDDDSYNNLFCKNAISVFKLEI